MSGTAAFRPRLNHVAISVEPAMLDDQGRPDLLVHIIERESRTTHGTTGDYTLTSAYVGFVLPLMIELQHLERVGDVTNPGEGS